MKLSEFVKRRNGVSIGESDSLRNMLHRSLGAGKFSVFWKHWNPIWGYYLGKYIFKPLKLVFPPTLSLIITFVLCGFIHDLVIMLLKWQFTLLLTPWFFFMSLCVVLGDYLKLDYSKIPWIARALVNVIIISACLFIGYQVRF